MSAEKRKGTRVTVLVLSMSLALMLIASVCTMVYLFNNPGVQRINAFQKINGDIAVNVKYFACSGYSVKSVSDGEVEYKGEMPIAYDGDVGKYCVKIVLNDVQASNGFASKYDQWKPYTLKNGESELKFKWFYNSDHGVTIYVGCDTPIEVEEQDRVKLSGLGEMGTLKVNVKLKK